MKNIVRVTAAVVTFTYFELCTVSWLAGYDSLMQFVSTI